MDQIFQTLFPYLMTVLGVVVSIMLGNILKKQSENSREIKALQERLNDLTLHLAKLTPTLMSTKNCLRIRAECIQLNKKIILEPLQKQLEAHIKDSDERWSRLEQEAEQLWLSLKNHAHTEQGVVISPRKS
jgi:hypothetical protein